MYEIAHGKEGLEPGIRGEGELPAPARERWTGLISKYLRELWQKWILKPTEQSLSGGTRSVCIEARKCRSMEKSPKPQHETLTRKGSVQRVKAGTGSCIPMNTGIWLSTQG